MTIDELKDLKKLVSENMLTSLDATTAIRFLIDAEIERQIGCDECEDCCYCVNSGTRLCYEDCGDSYDYERTGKQAYKHYKPKYNYCPNCGRKM